MPKHLKSPENEHRLLAIAAARFRSRNLTQAKIAKRLRLSQPEVSRLISYAKEHQFLARAPSFLSQNVDPAELAEVDRLYFVHDQLCPALRDLAPAGLHLDVWVLPPGDEAFASAAASCVSELLHRARVVGIMWGRSLERLVSRVRGCLDRAGQDEAYDVQCIPLCGDPVHLMNLGHVRYSASQLAAALSRALNPERPSDQPCLVGVPAYLPRRFFLGNNGDSIWQHFVEGIPGYREIFGPGDGDQAPWVDRVDTIITGAGIIVSGSRRHGHSGPPSGMAAHAETGDFIHERLTQEEELTEGALATLVHGDIGGWLLAKEGLRPADQRRVDSLNQTWTGIKGEHLANVAKKAKPGGAPGVILVAAGRAKAEMVRELVKRGLVNIVLIDTSLAAELP